MRQQVPTTQVLILGVLPRGAWSLPNVWAWPNRMTAGITALNSASKVSLPSFCQNLPCV